MLSSALMGALFLFLSSISINIMFLNVCIFFTGWTLTGFEIASLVYVSEMGATRFRKLSLVVMMSGWSLG
jgi:hypothetical protein